MQGRDIDRSQLDSTVDAALNDAVLDAMQKQLAPLGKPSSFALRSDTSAGGMTSYTFVVTWSKGTLYYTFALDDKTGKIAGLFFRAGPPPKSGA